jgi:alpha-1,6-mannosyltransferase
MRAVAAQWLRNTATAKRGGAVMWAASVAALLAAQCSVVIVLHSAQLPQQWLAMGALCAAGALCTLCLLLPAVQTQLRCKHVFLLALVSRAIALCGVPLLDDDYFRFLWDGYQLLQGASPYAHAPAEFFLRTDTPAAWQAVLSQINHPDIATIYGPFLQLLFASGVWIADAQPLGLQIVWALAELLCIGLVLRSGVLPWQAALYVVNPLVLKEISYALHPDGIIATLLAAAAVLALARKPVFSGIALGAVIAAKLPLVLLALCFAAQRQTGFITLRWALITAALLYAPFVATGAFGLEGLAAFAQQWRVNPVGFTVFEWLLQDHARSAAVLFAGVVTCGCAVAVHRQRLSLPVALLICLGSALATAPANNPWYWLLLLPLALVANLSSARFLITPWVASFVVLSGYMNGHLLNTFAIDTDLTYAQVHPLARLVQALCIGGALWVDLARGQTLMSRRSA